MAAKKNIINILLSFLFILIFDIVYTVSGLLVVSHISIIPLRAVIAIILLCGLAALGYFIGAKLFNAAKIKILTIVLIPVILIMLTFGLSIITVPVISMLIQYPAAILTESFGYAGVASENPVVFYLIAVLFHLLYSFSMFIGSYNKKYAKG